MTNLSDMLRKMNQELIIHIQHSIENQQTKKCGSREQTTSNYQWDLQNNKPWNVRENKFEVILSVFISLICSHYVAILHWGEGSHCRSWEVRESLNLQLGFHPLAEMQNCTKNRMYMTWWAHKPTRNKGKQSLLQLRKKYERGLGAIRVISLLVTWEKSTGILLNYIFFKSRVSFPAFFSCDHCQQALESIGTLRIQTTGTTSSVLSG